MKCQQWTGDGVRRLFADSGWGPSGPLDLVTLSFRSLLLIVSILTSGIVKGGPSYLASSVDKILSCVETSKVFV